MLELGRLVIESVGNFQCSHNVYHVGV